MGKITFAVHPLTETKKIVTTCKVWGFLKYYHSNVANGNFDWDAELIEILPKLKNYGEF